ncbi:MAG: peptidylprolyl isomerase A [Gammaproteobacteria bacterium]|nr:peptidylprolyl isomerase A [Gammaproteobacteria bacterium]
MNYFLRTILIIFIFIASIGVTQAAPKAIIKIETSLGNIIVELDHQRAPATVKNFLYYTKKKFYNGTIFHRVIPNFMIQGGGFDVGLSKKSTRSPIRNEGKNGLTNSYGTIAMARTNDPDSATSQFYINTKENTDLNSTFDKYGYTVFGNVIEGMDIVMKISDVPTQKIMNIGDYVPSKPVIIKSVTQLNDPKKSTEKPKEVKTPQSNSKTNNSKYKEK